MSTPSGDPENPPEAEPSADLPPGGLPVGLVVVFYGLMGGLGALVAWIFDVPSLWWTEPGPPGPIPEWLGLLAGIAIGLLAHLGSNLVRRIFGWTQGFYEQMRRMLGPLSTGQVVVAATASAVAEEVLFRGALLPVVGLWPQAILFGLVHLAPGRDFRFWPFYAAAMGLVLGLLYQASGTLLAPILAHFTVNYFGLSQLRRADDQ
jgi:uncharacterized protein